MGEGQGQRTAGGGDSLTFHMRSHTCNGIKSLNKRSEFISIFII